MSGNNRMASGATGHKCSMLDSLLATLGCLSVLAVGVAGCGSLSAPARYDRAQATAVPQRPAPTSGTSSRVPFLADTPWIGELYQRSDRARVTAESRFIEVDPGDEFLVIERGEGSADIGEYGVETSTNAIASDPADRTSHKEGEPYLFPPKTRWAEITTRQPAAGRAEVTRRKTSALAVRDIPGGGGLLARRAGADKDVSVPLQHTDVKARVSAYVGAVEVTQQFANPFDEAIEAVYVFPLPTDAAVHDFILTIGERRIRGIVRERAEAQRIYQEARAAGHTASLLTQNRPNVFTQQVANIAPKAAIDVNIKYFHCLPYIDGAYEFVFPMVVGPRFNPPGTHDGVGAVGRRAAGASGQTTEVAYLRPNERSAHDIGLDLELDAGVAIEEIASPSHAIVTERPTAARAHVRLAPGDTLPNKDFVLRFKVAGRALKTNLLTHRDARGGFFTLVLYPPDDAAAPPARRPVEMIFVLDCSDSMSGAPLEKSKQAIERALRRLAPQDTFQLVRFSERASQLGTRPVEATPENVRRGLAYLASLEGEGGTMMIEGIKAALDFPHDPERYRIVSFWTDGYIGNEQEIFAEVERRLGASRLFSFGIGSSVNRYLLDGLARQGRGVASYVGLDESAGAEVDRFYERLRRPALTDVAIEWGDLKATDVYPSRIPDLLPGRPVIVTGRCAAGAGKAAVRLTGDLGGERRTWTLTADLDDTAARHPGIPLVWARTQIGELDEAQATSADSGLPGRITALALEFGLVSSYTSFVAVDSLTRLDEPAMRAVQVAVPVPAGVRYETTVDESSRRAARAPARERR